APALVLAMASNRRGRLVCDTPDRRPRLAGDLLDGMGSRAVQHLPDQPFRALWTSAGVRALTRQAASAAGVQDAVALQVGEASNLSGTSARVLGNADHDAWPLAVCGREHGLHPDRSFARRARSHRGFRRSVSPLQGAGLHARPASEAESRTGRTGPPSLGCGTRAYQTSITVKKGYERWLQRKTFWQTTWTHFSSATFTGSSRTTRLTP